MVLNWKITMQSVTERAKGVLSNVFKACTKTNLHRRDITATLHNHVFIYYRKCMSKIVLHSVIVLLMDGNIVKIDPQEPSTRRTTALE